MFSVYARLPGHWGDTDKNRGGYTTACVTLYVKAIRDALFIEKYDTSLGPKWWKEYDDGTMLLPPMKTPF